MSGTELKVLALSPHTASQGGVSSSVSLTRRSMRPSTIVERLAIGKRPGESGKGLPVFRLLGD